jgi:hypothetical protein
MAAAANPWTSGTSINDLFTIVDDVIRSTNDEGHAEKVMLFVDQAMQNFNWVRLNRTRLTLLVWLLHEKNRLVNQPVPDDVRQDYTDINLAIELSQEQKDTIKTWFRETYPAIQFQGGRRVRKGTRKSRKSKKASRRRGRK